jgi:hypothetical protein
MILIVRVILITVEKSLILPGFTVAFLISMKCAKQYDTRLFLVFKSKKDIELDFWMFNILKNNFPGTLNFVGDFV